MPYSRALPSSFFSLYRILESLHFIENIVLICKLKKKRGKKFKFMVSCTEKEDGREWQTALETFGGSHEANLSVVLLSLEVTSNFKAELSSR